MNTNTSPIDELNPDLIARAMVLIVRLVKIFRGTFHVDKVRSLAERQEAKTKLKLPEGLHIESQNYGGVACTNIVNNKNLGDNSDKKLIVYFHGGGMCMRMPTAEINAIAPFCEKMAADAIMPWYGLAPEHPFPKGIEDCFTAYNSALECGFSPRNIIIGGLSAGGGNCLSVLALIKQRHLPMPACAVLLSPSGDSLFAAESWVSNSRKDPMFSLADIIYCRNLAIAPEQVAHPLLNVHLMDDFSGYPPMYLTASTHEVMRDVSIVAAQKAWAASVPAQLDLYRGGLHGMHLTRFTRQAQRGWARIYKFVEHYGFSVE